MGGLIFFFLIVFLIIYAIANLFNKGKKAVKTTIEKDRIAREKQKEIYRQRAKEEREKQEKLKQKQDEEQKQREYSKTNLGKIENFKNILLQKRQEMFNGIEIIKKDIERHKEYVDSLQKELDKKQIDAIRIQMEGQIESKTKKQKVLAKYIQLLEKYIASTEIQENSLGVLFTMVKFNEESMSMKDYEVKYKDLDKKISLFNDYNFIDLTTDMISQSDDISMSDNIDRALLEMEIELQEHETEVSNLSNVNLEESILDNFGETLESFQDLMKKFRSPN